MSDVDPDQQSKPPFDYTFDNTTGVRVGPMIDADGNARVTYFANGLQVSREDYLAIIQTSAFIGADLYVLVDNFMDRLSELSMKIASQVGAIGVKA